MSSNLVLPLTENGMTVEIVEVTGRASQGMTKPYICRGDDGDIYFVKGRGSGRSSQVAEWIAGKLGLSLGLPIPAFEIVDIPAELSDLTVDFDLGELGEGPAFGSRREELNELYYSQIDEVPLQQRLDVLAFDFWIRNEDRSLTSVGGNPNAFWSPAEQKLLIFDHNSAFDPDFNRTRFLSTHVFKDAAPALFDDMHRYNDYNRLFSEALANWDQIIRDIPDSWYYLDIDQTNPADINLDLIYRQLSEHQDPSFWRAQ